MSTLFFDNLLELDKVDKSIKKVTSTREEAIELWEIVDEIIHHRVFGCVMQELPKKHHEEFLKMFHKNPSDESLLDYLREKVKKDVALVIKESVSLFVLELTKELESGGKLK